MPYDETCPHEQCGLVYYSIPDKTTLTGIRCLKTEPSQNPISIRIRIQLQSGLSMCAFPTHMHLVVWNPGRTQLGLKTAHKHGFNVLSMHRICGLTLNCF
jgi:hypothetical protein